MLKITKSGVKEIGYNIQDEAKLAAVFGIGNGYFGLRGSFEEFADVFIQGTYIRGLFDRIVEIPLTFSDNVYMKQYYFDHQKLKEFELEDSCINVCDPLLIRVHINGKYYLPWYGTNIKWERYIDTKTGGLFRHVVWDDGEGHLTEMTFYRFASFANNHLILQKAIIKKINHNLPIQIELGVDTLVKTNGQHKSKVTFAKQNNDGCELNFFVGDKYNMEASLASVYDVKGGKFNKTAKHDEAYSSFYDMNDNEIVVTKVTSMYASCDPVNDFKNAPKGDLDDYDKLYAEHLKAYKKAFKKVDIQIKGDEKIDTLVRYANYQTLIGFDRFDSVHSLSAKNLTAEKYNQFVWWDAEIFQLPFVISNFPEAAKHCLEYRYRLLEQSKINAQKDGLDGAKFAFCSSVKGDENVWIYARHPFLQIHINSDVAYGVYNYYKQTLDKEFLINKGLPMMIEVMKYFYSRATLDKGLLHLNNVTGTDEHHPYVNDDAYTNYQVKFLCNKILDLAKEFNYDIDKETENKINKLAKDLYLPEPNEKGVIPQFRNYFKLKPYLPLVGNGSAKGFQMKASGLYHQSQIIKQPDVLNLYTYLDVGMDEKLYKANWKFYYKKCEASSSLTYPVHTISAIDFNENDLFIKNLLESLQIDIEDLHNCAYQGVHAGCLAGGWFAMYRGVFGLIPREDELVIDPKFNMPFESIKMNFVYQGVIYIVTLDHKVFTISSASKKPITINYKGYKVVHCGGTTRINKK